MPEVTWVEISELWDSERGQPVSGHGSRPYPDTSVRHGWWNAVAAWKVDMLANGWREAVYIAPMVAAGGQILQRIASRRNTAQCYLMQHDADVQAALGTLVPTVRRAEDQSAVVPGFPP